MSTPTPDQRSAAHRYLRRIVALRVQLVIVLLLLASLSAFLLDYVGGVQGWDWSSAAPLREIAAATLSTGIIGVVWEWFIRTDAAETLRRTVEEIGEQQRPALAHAAASAVVNDDRLLHSLLSTDNADRVLHASLTSTTGHPDLADGLRRSMVDTALAAEDYWENYRARIYLADSTDLLDDGGMDTFFDVTVEIRYEALLRKSVFRFGASTSRAAAEEMTADRAFDGCWFIARSRPYLEASQDLFRLHHIRVAGAELDISTRNDGKRLVYTAESSSLGEYIGTRVSVEYRYLIKLDKRGHSYAMNVRVPTRRAEYEFDHSQSSIAHVNVFPFLVCANPPTVRTSPDTPRAGIVQVETDDWTFPPGGVVFAWLLQEEKKDGFRRAISGPPHEGG